MNKKHLVLPLRKTHESKSLGFTLAEVLIVLAIIGTIAALVIPITIQKYRNTETITRLKMAYKMLTDLTETSRIENGSINFARETYATRDFNKCIRPYIQIDKDCGVGNQTGRDRCFASPKGGWYDILDFDVADAMSGYGTDRFYKVVLHNGMSLAFYAVPWSTYGTKTIFVVDVDGPYKGYQKLGQDTFVFTWNHQKDPWELVPGSAYGGGWQNPTPIWYNAGNTRNFCLSASGDYAARWISETRIIYRGSGCSAYIIKNNYKFPSDYPFNKASKRPGNFMPVKN